MSARKIYITCILLITFVSVYAQKQHPGTKSKKASEYFYEADNFRVRGQFVQALEWLNKAVEKDDKFYEAWLMIGVIDKAKGDLPSAQKALERLLDLERENQAPAYFELADLYVQTQEYNKAIDMAERFLTLNPKNKQRREEAEQFRDNARFALDNAARAEAFDTKPMPTSVNAFPMQYFPVLTVDGKGIVFTRRMGATMDYDEDLVISHKNPDGTWTHPESLSENITSDGNEGTCTISADGRKLIFTSCYGRPGYGSCDLFISKRTGDVWSSPKNLGPAVNSESWESQPSLSSDGRTLYFVSTRKGGLGRRDIWVSRLNDKDEWMKPTNMGTSINTSGDDVSPFIHPNGVTLYFASNGRTGFGGYDIYYSEKANADWGEAKNFGAPVNTGEDQVSLFISADGQKGYYSLEDQQDPEVKSKLYEFDIPKDMQVKTRATYVYGKITDSLNHEALAADIELFDLTKDERIGFVRSDSITGEYLIVLPEGSQYALYVNEAGYLFNSLSFTYSAGEDLKAIEKNIALIPIKKGSAVTLNNIFFETDKYELVQRSRTELEKIIRFLGQNPDIRIEIEGHTDNVGTQAYNQELSTKRAKAVFEYLTQNGVDNGRVTYKGYGQTRPSVPNDSEQHRSQNRRIEFRIL